MIPDDLKAIKASVLMNEQGIFISSRVEKETLEMRSLLRARVSLSRKNTRMHFFSQVISYYPCKDLALAVILMELINSISKSNPTFISVTERKSFCSFSFLK